MSSIRSYTSEENLRRIKMQKSLTFVIVEGSDDVPIYESCLSSMLPDCTHYDVIYSGGKTAIRNYLQDNKTANAVFVIDRDFHDIGIEDKRIVSLDRYSVENYFICEEVISYSLQFALGCKFRDALEAFSLNEYIESVTNALETLIKVIFYYQRVVAPQHSGEIRPAWSDVFLCENSSWRLCNTKIQELTNQLLPDAALIQSAIEYYDQHFALGGSVIENFPGKILKHSLQRYIRHKVIDLKPTAKGKYNDVETTRAMLSSVMHRSRHMMRVLSPVVAFVKDREVAAL